MKPITTHSPVNFSSKLEGVHQGMAERVYRAEPALATSDLKLLENPRAFWQRITKRVPFPRTPAMKLGTLFHTYILEPDVFTKTVTVCPDEFANKTRKAGKEWWAQHGGPNTIKEADLQQIKTMADALLALPEGDKIMDCQAEVSVFSQTAWPVASKCRIDAYDPNTATVYDIKTCAPGGAHPMAFRRQSKALKYYMQQFNYTHIASREGLPIKRWVWMVVETGGDYLAAAYEYAREDMVQAGKEVTANIERLMDCLELDIWPDYTPIKPETIQLFY